MWQNAVSAQSQAGMAKQVAKAAYLSIDPTRCDETEPHLQSTRMPQVSNKPLETYLRPRRYHQAPALPAEQQALPWQPSQNSSSVALGSGALKREDFVAAIVTSKHNEHVATAGRLWRQVSVPTSCACACSPPPLQQGRLVRCRGCVHSWPAMRASRQRSRRRPWLQVRPGESTPTTGPCTRWRCRATAALRSHPSWHKGVFPAFSSSSRAPFRVRQPVQYQCKAQAIASANKQGTHAIWVLLHAKAFWRHLQVAVLRR